MLVRQDQPSTERVKSPSSIRKLFPGRGLGFQRRVLEKCETLSGSFQKAQFLRGGREGWGKKEPKREGAVASGRQTV